jgi:hypothetical protein
MYVEIYGVHFHVYVHAQTYHHVFVLGRVLHKVHVLVHVRFYVCVNSRVIFMLHDVNVVMDAGTGTEPETDTVRTR